MLIPKIVDGSELDAGLPEPFYALAQFYREFNQRNYKGAADNWHTEHALMSNPIGGIRRTWQQIFDGYRRIMSGPARVYVEFYEFEWCVDGNLFYVAGRERGSLTLHDKSFDLRIRTSRIYRQFEERWQQVHHHGSMDEPELLARYQDAILSAEPG